MTSFRPLVRATLVVMIAGIAIAAVRLPIIVRQARSGPAFERALPQMDGSKLNVKVVEVRYGPGQASTPHRHGCAVMVYVVSGAVRMGVRGGTDSVYRAGQVFFERPTDIHQVGANASATDSAHFTATFVCDHVGPLSVPVPWEP